jgi:hypothetical protein
MRAASKHSLISTKEDEKKLISQPPVQRVQGYISLCLGLWVNSFVLEWPQEANLTTKLMSISLGGWGVDWPVIALLGGETGVED